MRTFGLLLILLTGLLTGHYFAKRSQQRAKELEIFENLFREIEARISFALTPTGEILHALQESPSFKSFSFLRVLCDALESGANLCDAWKNALELYQSTSALRKEDYLFLVEFSVLFGNTDKEGQQQNCQFFMEKTKDKRMQLLEDLKTKQKLSYALGAFFGLFCCIIFM